MVVATPVFLLLLFSLGYGALGALFGYKWPGAKWMWGLWLAAISLPITVAAKIVFAELGVTFSIAPELILFLNIPGIILSCIGSGLAARYALQKSQQGIIPPAR